MLGNQDVSEVKDFADHKYVVLCYDIKTEDDDLANHIRSKIKPFALSVNKSVYVAPTEHLKTIEELIKEAHLYVDQKRKEKKRKGVAETKVRVIHVATHSVPGIMDWCNEAAQEFAGQITSSIEERMKNVVPLFEKYVERSLESGSLKDYEITPAFRQTEIVKRKKAIVRELKKRVQEVEKHLFWFAATDDVKGAMKATAELIKAEEDALNQINSHVPAPDATTMQRFFIQ